ncbi:MAG: hypothetical protein A2293_13200 [Elusimicrobia bacterium RIFOXYB2_FULL_49_7]|nr:MAG: hypothetical protein A2293_13200 [Elusimicrobia bacterium RIFOXYB2_FULL_49_7]
MSLCAACRCRSKVSKPSAEDIVFKPLVPADFQPLGAFLQAHPHSLSGYTLAILASWNPIFHYQWAFPEPSTLLLSYSTDADNTLHLLQPIGSLTPAIQQALLHRGRCQKGGLDMVGVEPGFATTFPDFAAHFNIKPAPEHYNYLYRAEDLALLAGRRYAKKRNLIAQAEDTYAWSVERLTPGNVADCITLVNEYMTDLKGPLSASLRNDDFAIRTALHLFDKLPLDGTLIRVDGKTAAFSICEPQTKDTAVIHFERALKSYKGIYQVVNKAAAQAIFNRGFTFINREEDMGDPGLRQAKESYHPVRLSESVSLTLKR